VREEPFDKAHEIAKAAGVSFHLTAHATLIACDDAIAFLEGCRAAGVQVFGVEGFDLGDRGCRPDMEAILDLSAMDDPSGSVDEAQSLVGRLPRGSDVRVPVD
jgi:hypothetical protein